MGCGDVGSELGRLLVAQGYQVAGLRRSAASLPLGMRALQGDVTQPATLQSVKELEPDLLVYAVAASTHTDEGYRASYVEGLRNVLTALADSKTLHHVIFTSSTGVYGQFTDELLDETSLPIPENFSGTRMLEAESVLKDFAWPSTVVRLSGIYGPGRNRMLSLAREPQRWPQFDSWTNRIHRDDASRAIAHILDRVAHGQPVDNCYLVTDSQPALQYEVLQWLALQQAVSNVPQTAPLVASGKRVNNQRLLETGFKLKFPDYMSGYGNLLADLKAS